MQGRTSPARLALLSLLATVIGLLGGGAAFVLIRLIGLLTNALLFHRYAWALPSFAHLQRSPELLVVAAGGGLMVSLLAKWCPEIRGHGIPEAMEAVLTKQSRIRARTAFAKPLSAVIAIGTGGPFGAEGPIIVTGGALGSLLGQLLPMSPSERKILLACGAAAGMAATFGTPLAAVVLIIELLLFEFSARAFIPLVVSSALAGGVHSAIFGTGPLFAVPAHDYNGLDKLPLYAVLGVACGLLAVVITKGLVAVEDGYRRLPIPAFWHPVIGAVGFAAIGLAQPRALGVGYDVISDVLLGRIAVAALILLALAKLLAWWVALASGTSGGTLAPLLLIGGAFGSLVGTAINHFVPGAHVSPGAFALVAMAATFGASVRATFAAIVFLFELTRDYQIILPLMLASVAAQAVAGALLRDSLMTEKLTRRGLHVESDFEADVLASASVGDVMTSQVDTLPATVTIREARARIDSGGHGAYPLVDNTGRCVAIIARQDLLEAGGPGTQPALEHASRDMVTVGPGDSLRTALRRMLEEDVGHLPVLSGDRLVGMCTRTDILRARQRRIDEEHLQPGWHHAPTPNGIRHAPVPRTGSKRAGEEEVPMRLCLVVENQSLDGEALHKLILARLAAGACHFHVVVPASGPHDPYQQLLDSLEGEVPDPHAANDEAQMRLDRALSWLRSLGAAADGEIGDPHPMVAIANALGALAYDEIIVSSPAPHLSRWVHMDLAARVSRSFHLPVTSVVSPPVEQHHAAPWGGDAPEPEDDLPAPPWGAARLRVIAVGFDNAGTAPGAAHWCATVAAATGARVVAVHGLGRLPGVLIGGPDAVAAGLGLSHSGFHSWTAEIRSHLEDWCAPMREAGVAYQAELVDGDTEDALLAMAAREGADLIVVAAQGHAGMVNRLLGGGHHKLAQHAQVPVVLIPGTTVVADPQRSAGLQGRPGGLQPRP